MPKMEIRVYLHFWHKKKPQFPHGWECHAVNCQCVSYCLKQIIRSAHPTDFLKGFLKTYFLLLLRLAFTFIKSYKGRRKEGSAVW